MATGSRDVSSTPPRDTSGGTTRQGEILVAPTREDPWARWASASLGGPPGAHAARHPRITALVAALTVCVATFTVGLVHLAPCAGGSWWNPPDQYADQCWSSHPYDYTGSGLAERTPLLSDGSGRFPPSTDSPVVAVAAYGASLGTAAVSGWPDVSARNSRPVSELSASEGVRAEAVTYTGVVSLLMLLAALASVAALARTHRPRPWDAMALAGAPALVLTAVMGWDMAAVALACGALWAWSRGRVALSGVLAGVGVATAWWPVVVPAAAVLLCLRERRTAAAGRLTAATAAGFAAVVLPAFLLAGEGVSKWLETATTLDVEDGSTWQLAGGASSGGWQVPGAFALVLLSVAALAIFAPRRPRLPQVALLALLGVLVVHDTHEPQTVLWLLPLAALARPRWRDLTLWQLAELFFVVALAWHQHGYTVGDGEDDMVLTLAVLGRLVAELMLAALVVRDVLRPWADPVRADGQLDDPAGGVLDETALS